MIRKHDFNQRLGLGLGLILLGLGLLLNWICGFSHIHSEVIQLSRNPKQTLIGRLYSPLQTNAPYPTLMLWHGVSCTKEMMEPLAIELARQGVMVLTFDGGGFGESYKREYDEQENLADARAIAAYVYAHPERFDATRIGVGGHSMGGATALFLANGDSRIKTAILLGMGADINRVLPPNLLMGTGLYEQFYTPEVMRSMLQQGTGEAAKEFQFYGNLTKGTARKLIISPTSDHLIEPVDPTLIRETVAWTRQVFDIKTSPQGLIMPGFILGQVLLLLGSIISVSYCLRDNSYGRKHPRLVSMGFVAMALLMLSLGMTGQIPERLTTDLIVLAAILLPISHYAISHPTRLTPFFCITGLYAVLIVFAYAMVAAVLQGHELITHPALILGLPQFMLQMPIALIYTLEQKLRADLFPIYSHGVMPSWTVLLLFLPELIRPGIVLRVITQAAIWLARWLRQPLQIRWKERPSGRLLQLLAGLIILLIGVLYQQTNGKDLSSDYIWTGLKLLVRMELLPALLIVGMMRSRLLQKIETRCWQSYSDF